MLPLAVSSQSSTLLHIPLQDHEQTIFLLCKIQLRYFPGHRSAHICASLQLAFMGSIEVVPGPVALSDHHSDQRLPITRIFSVKQQNSTKRLPKTSKTRMRVCVCRAASAAAAPRQRSARDVRWVHSQQLLQDALREARERLHAVTQDGVTVNVNDAKPLIAHALHPPLSSSNDVFLHLDRQVCNCYSHA